MDSTTLTRGGLRRTRKAKRDDVQCPSTPACDCAPGWNCVATARTKSTCATVKCVQESTGKTVANGASGSGVNPAVIAGPVVAVVAILAASLAVWWWLRKKKAKDLARLAELEARAKRAEQETLAIGMRSPQPPIPSTLHQRHTSQSGNSNSGGSGTSAEHNPTGIPMTQTYPIGRALTPLASSSQHPHDPSSSTTAGRSTLKVYSSQSINLDPSHPSNQNPTSPTSPLGLPHHPPPDPFSDSASIATSADGLSFLSQSTNVIPIAYVPGPSYCRPISTTYSAFGGPPNRPLRDPTLDLGINYGPQHGASAASVNPTSRLNPATTKSGVAIPHDASSINSRQSASPSFLSFNSTNFALDTPTIGTVNVGVAQRANIIHLNSSGNNNNNNRSPPVPSFPPPSAYSSSSLKQKSPPSKNSRLAVASKPVAGRSPLSQAAATASSLLSDQPPSPGSPSSSSPVREPHDPFNDLNKAAHLSVIPASPSETLIHDPRFSIAETTRSGMSRPYSSASDQSEAVVLGSATVVNVGEEAQNNTLFRSGSVSRLKGGGSLRRKVAEGAGGGGGGGSGERSSAASAGGGSSLEQHSEEDENRRASAGTTFTTASNGLGAYPFVPTMLGGNEMPEQQGSPSFRRPNPPFVAAGGGGGGGSQRDTQYSGLSQFDFLPPANMPDRNWGHGSNPSSSSNSAIGVKPVNGGGGETRNSLDTLQLVNELKGFPQF